MRGDLDWIVMKCLEKDRQRRYETANGLAADVARHLNSEPVVARAPGNLYRFQKLVRRHKVAFAAAGAVIAALVIGLGVSTWSLFREKEARQIADAAREEEARLRHEADADRKKAQLEAKRSQLVAHYLEVMLDEIAPSLAKRCTTKYVQEVLTRVDTRFGDELKDQPDIEAMVRTALAELQGNIGQFERAEMNLRKAVEIRKKLSGSESPEVAASVAKLADLLQSSGKRLEAEALYRDAITMFKQLVRSDPKRQEYRQDLGHIQWRLGYALAETHRREAAMQAVLDALQVFEQAARDFPGNPFFRQEQAFSHRTLGDWFEEAGQLEQTELHYRTAIRFYTALIAERPTNEFYSSEEAWTTWVLGSKLERAGRLDAAIAEYRRALALYETAIPRFPGNADFRGHRDSLRNALVSKLQSQGKQAEAETLIHDQSQESAVRQLASSPQLAGLPPPVNLISNGSFDLPVHAGHGDTYSSEESFELPGWTYSIGPLRFFLEYGEPLRRARYADGRQAVCLNGDGRQPPITLAQTFATIPGEDYTLSFAQGDEQMAGPSNSELTVSVADVQCVFSREHDTGMVVKILHFTARSNFTTLRFADTSPSTPDAIHSPFLDAVSVVHGEIDVPVINTAPGPPLGQAATELKPAAMELVGQPVPRSVQVATAHRWGD